MNSIVIRSYFTENHPDKDYDNYLRWEYDSYRIIHSKNSVLQTLVKPMSFDEFVTNHEIWIVDVLKGAMNKFIKGYQ